MKKSEFIALLDSPEKLGGEHIVGLQEAVKEFPYFQSAQLLLTKAFHKTENLNFEGQLKKAAAFASDRKRLHRLIFDEDQDLNSDKLDTPSTLFAPEKPVEHESVIETSLGNPITKAPVVDEANPLPATELNRPSFIPDFSLVAEDSETHPPAVHPLDDQLQKQVITEAIHQSILMEVDDELTEMNQENSEEFPAHETQDNVQVVQNFDEESGHSFSDWLNFYKEENETANSTSLWENTSEESKEAIASFRPDANLPVRQEFYSAAKMAKLSVQEDDDLVTETLANIYAEQNNFEKAIKAFKKLQLKYPEKNVYFAGCIKEIENQINS